MYDVLIIGAGTAGLTAAIYCQRAGLKSICFEGLFVGGRIINTPDIANYPGLPGISGLDYSNILRDQAKNLGAEIKMELVTSANLNDTVKIVTTRKGEYTGKAIIIANGEESRKLGVPGEEQFIGSGVSYCATCDGAFMKNRTVAIVGGGNTACDDAVYLSNIAEKVYLVYRGEKLRADKSTVDKLKIMPNVEIIYNTTVTAINGNKSVESITTCAKDGTVYSIDINAVFIAIGAISNNGIFKGQIALDEYGYFNSTDTTTELSGVFVAGDTVNKQLKQLVTAASDGALAAKMAFDYISLI